jgi:photosystem II stability/assembly factor-like uncharacterized protein
MKTKLALFVALLFLGTTLIRAQAWMANIPEGKKEAPSLSDMKMAFDQYWSERPIVAHKGHKQFKRMEWFMTGRTDEKGHLPNKIYWEEANKALQKRGQAKRSLAAWEPLGPFDTPLNINNGARGGSGRIDCIIFHPSDEDIFWVGAPAGGLWKTTDGGQSWTVLTDHLPTLGVGDLAVNPNNPDIMYLGTGTRDTWWETFSVGVLKTTDGGLNWDETGLGFEIDQKVSVNELLMDPNNPDILLAATRSGIYKTSNAGDNWDLIESGWFIDLETKPGDFSVIYASRFDYYGNARLYKSINSGESFDMLTNIGFDNGEVNRIAIAVSPANPEMVTIICSNYPANNFHSLYKSTDNGANWTDLMDGSPLNLLGYNTNGYDNGGQGSYTLSLAISPLDENEIWVGGVNIWKSDDGGSEWDLNAHWLGQGGVDYVHADIHALKYNPLNNVLYNGNDGGIYKLQPDGEDWTDLSDGLEIFQIYRIGIYANRDELAIAGPQDNGPVIINEGVANELTLAEACDNFFDYTDPNTVYFGGYGGLPPFGKWRAKFLPHPPIV